MIFADIPRLEYQTGITNVVPKFKIAVCSRAEYSSALYPLDTMPGWMRVIALLNPTTYAVEGMRSALFGSGSLNLVVCLAVLSGCAVLCTWFSVKTFQRVVQ